MLGALVLLLRGEHVRGSAVAATRFPLPSAPATDGATQLQRRSLPPLAIFSYKSGVVRRSSDYKRTRPSW
jgi:hypothetical protein